MFCLGDLFYYLPMLLERSTLTIYVHCLRPVGIVKGRLHDGCIMDCSDMPVSSFTWYDGLDEFHVFVSSN